MGTVAFNAICKAMLKLNQMAIVRVCPRDNQQPFLAALVAQVSDGEAEYDGMHLIPLPYMDDIRDFRIDATITPEKTQASEEQIDAARKVVTQISLVDFSSYEFENPVVQKHYCALQAMALEQDEIDWDDKADDDIQPDPFDRFEGVLQSFKDSFDHIENPEPPKGKRKASGGGGAAKKPKVDAASLDWPKLLQKDQIKKQTVPTLKGYLKSKGLPVDGKKAGLVERVTDHVSGA